MTAEQPSTSGQLIGSVLLGRYRVVRELAKGGMGVVYLARAEGAVGFVKPYVIKLVLPEHSDNQRFINMFVREATILSNLRHPGIVSVVELGEREDDGALVMVLEYVRGYHLGQWAKFVRLTQRTIPTANLLQLMIEVLDALHYAHTMVHPDGKPMHIVHRDVSPSNILLDEDGRARLLDFGVARMRGSNGDYHTQVKGFVGKLMYSAPELFAESEASAQSDLYSCAVVLHEILLGRNTFRGETQASTLNRVLHHAPERIEVIRSDVPRGLDAVLKKALAKHPRDRFADARAFAAALRTLQREPENEVRARLAAQLKVDFSHQMAEMLGLESLADRDEAWRRLSHITPPRMAPEVRQAPTILGGGSEGPRRATSSPPPRMLSRPPPPPPPLEPTAFDVPRRIQDSSGTLLQAPPPLLPSGLQRLRGRIRGLPAFVAGLAVSGALITGIVFALQREPQFAAPLPPIRVVTESPLTTTTGVQLPDPLTTSIEESAPESPLRTSSERRERHAKSSPDPMSLTRALRKQQGKVEECFGRHASALTNLPTMQLEFDLTASGKLSAVRVLPASMSGTALGKCLQTVAEGTHFPGQGRAVSFAIPITASRSASR
jgi:eukaryotic-like serine/threonine-protein kinase